MYERLTTRLANGGVGYDNGEYFKVCYPWNEHCLTDIDRMAIRLCEIEDKICEGGMLELPCKIGQTVWVVTSPYNISGYEFEGDGEKVKVFECVVESITFYSKGTHQVRCYCNGEFVAHYLRFCDFGKTVFLTPEEANNKLKELQK